MRSCVKIAVKAASLPVGAAVITTAAPVALGIQAGKAAVRVCPLFALLLAGCAAIPDISHIPPSNPEWKFAIHAQAQARNMLPEVERKLGMRFQGEAIHFSAPSIPWKGPSVRVEASWPRTQVHALGETHWMGDHALIILRDGYELHSKLYEHELAHAVLMSNGIWGHPGRYRSRFWEWHD
jgi:hypothetical protein